MKAAIAAAAGGAGIYYFVNIYVISVLANMYANNGNDRADHTSSFTKEQAQKFLEEDLKIFAKCKTVVKFMTSSKLKDELDHIDYVLFAKEVTAEERERFSRLYPDVLETCKKQIYVYNL